MKQEKEKKVRSQIALLGRVAGTAGHRRPQDKINTESHGLKPRSKCFYTFQSRLHRLDDQASITFSEAVAR